MTGEKPTPTAPRLLRSQSDGFKEQARTACETPGTRKPKTGQKGTARMAQENKNRRRQRHLCLMLTDGEAEILEARAKAAGLKKSAYARTILFGASAKEAEQRAEEQRQQAARLEAASADIRAALHELKKQGGNLNQIAYVLNRDGAAGATGAHVQAAADGVRSSAQAVVEVLKSMIQ